MKEIFADKVLRLRRAAGLTQAQFAERLLISRDYLSQLENGRKPGERLEQQIALLEQVGIAPLPDADRVGTGEVGEEQEPYGKKLSVAVPHKIPVVSWASAGAATNYEEMPKDWQDTISTECNDPQAFAVVVEGDSMLPDFRPGDLVIVMPSQEPRNHAPVLAKLKKDGVVLKILNLTGRAGKTVKLSSINPVYQPTDYACDDFHWIYPVHSSRRLHWR